jgi:hypothetical protein
MFPATVTLELAVQVNDRPHRSHDNIAEDHVVGAESEGGQTRRRVGGAQADGGHDGRGYCKKGSPRAGVVDAIQIQIIGAGGNVVQRVQSKVNIVVLVRLLQSSRCALPSLGSVGAAQL